MTCCTFSGTFRLVGKPKPLFSSSSRVLLSFAMFNLIPTVVYFVRFS